MRYHKIDKYDQSINTDEMHQLDISCIWLISNDMTIVDDFDCLLYLLH